MAVNLLIFLLSILLTACSIAPKPLSNTDRYHSAQEAISAINTSSPNTTLHLDYYEALARTVKYNLDYRLKLVNIALQARQLDVAVFTMFPALNVSGTLYTRNNDYSVSGISGNGISTGLSTSTPRTLRTSRIAMSWNVLDFAMGYVKAKQQSDRVLIAHEESRKQLQELERDLLAAYWAAYSAQQLLAETAEFQQLIARSKLLLEHALHDDLVPQESILTYQAALLDGERKLIQIQYKYDKAILDLKHLLFLPVDKNIILAKPPTELFKPQNLARLNLQKMDAVTLVYHPELRGQNYQERIAKFGVNTVIIQALPALTLNDGWNYDSNQFLLNKNWLDKSADLAWNLLNLASLPAAYRSAKMQAEYEKTKAMALTMAALTGERYAFKHYMTVNNEYRLAHKQTENARAMYTLTKNREKASVASDQQVILAKLKVVTTKIDEDLLLSELSVALRELYLSVGTETVTDDILFKPLEEATIILRNQLKENRGFVTFINRKYADLFRASTPSTDQYTIQLRAYRDINEAEFTKRKLEQNQGIEIAKIYENGRANYALIYGKFATKESAKISQAKLPLELKQFRSHIILLRPLAHI